MFAEIYRRHSVAVWVACSRYFYGREDIADLVQETFFRAFRSLGTLDLSQPLELRGWLATVAANLSKNELRKRSRRPVTRFVQKSIDSASVDALQESELLSRQRLDRARAAFEGLTPEQQEILSRADLEGVPYAEIARQQGLSLSAVKMRVLRARTALIQLAAIDDSGRKGDV